LSHFSENWNVLINFSQNQQHQFSWKSFQQLSCYFMRTDEQTEKGVLIGARRGRERAYKTNENLRENIYAGLE
jgi:hypothetical protein